MEGKGGVLIHVRMNIDYDQTASKRVLQEAISVLAQVQLVGPAAVKSQNGLSTTSLKKKKKTGKLKLI